VSVPVDHLPPPSTGSSAVARSNRPVTTQLRQDIETCLRTHYPGLVGILARRTGDQALAADLLQDAIVTALTRLNGAERNDPAVVAGFVFRTALFHLRNHQRLARIRSAPTALSTDDTRWIGEGDGEIALRLDADDEVLAAATATASPVAALERADLSAMVRRALEGLGNARDRELIVRFYLDEEDKQSICSQMGLTALHFNRVIHRARERLRAVMVTTGLTRWDAFGVFVMLMPWLPSGLVELS
jgi:RNA polymerase sigma-70 factor, ECF subfamily